MSCFQQSFRRSQQPTHSRGVMPASKRPRVSPDRKQVDKQENVEEDPFADDDITGEEWEYAASQAEIRLTQEQSKEPLKHGNGNQSNKMSNGASFKIPSAKVNNVKSNFSVGNSKFNNDSIKELRAKLAIYEKELKELELSYKRKDGETLVLRDRLMITEKSLTQEKVKVFEIHKRHEEAEVEREKNMQKELEKYRDQVQFKQAEIMESQNFIKNLETKNKLLEQQKIGQRVNSFATSSNMTKLSDVEWSGTQDSSSIAAKKIRLVKPESPRVSGSGYLCKPSFADEPLGRKKATKYSPSKPSSSSAFQTEPMTISEKSHIDEKISTNVKIKSKYFSKDYHKQTALKDLLSQTNRHNHGIEIVDVTSPLLHLLHSKNGKGNIGAGCLKGLLSKSQEDVRIFGKLCEIKKFSLESVINYEGNSEILLFIDGLLNSYVNLQDSLVGNRLTNQETPSYHTAPSEPVASISPVAPAQSISKTMPIDCSSVCKDTVAALHVLDTLTKNSSTLTKSITSQSSNILSSLLKMCDSERWNTELEQCQYITSLSLGIVTTTAKLNKDEVHMKRFQSIMKTELLISLVTHEDVHIQINAMGVITTLVYHPAFALSIVKDERQPDISSILCHICDISCSQQPEHINQDDWLCLLSKVVSFLSVFVAEHENILVENSCYSEIYRAADVMLYNELVCWKKTEHTTARRIQLIQRALCLLHSCANVYTDGIPGSRRDHRHQVVLTNLDGFLTKHEEKSSFWSQELSRIVKSEVGALFDELEIT